VMSYERKRCVCSVWNTRYIGVYIRWCTSNFCRRLSEDYRDLGSLHPGQDEFLTVLTYCKFPIFLPSIVHTCGLSQNQNFLLKQIACKCIQNTLNVKYIC
jgi:hypothetical protein